MEPFPDQPSGMIGIFPSATEITISETRTIRIPIVLKSLAAAGGDYNIQVFNVPRTWVKVLPAQTVFLAQGGKEQINLDISAPQGSAGSYELKVKAVSLNDQTTAGEASLALTITSPEVAEVTEAEFTKTELTKPSLGANEQILIKLQDVRFTCQPGEVISIPIDVTNRSLIRIQLNFAINNYKFPSNWISIEPGSFELDAGETKTFQMILSVPKTPSSKAGRYPFSLIVKSIKTPEIYSSADCIMTVRVFSQTAIQVAPLQVFSGQPMHVKVENWGNAAETFTVTWEGADIDLLRFEILPPPPVLSTPAAPTQAIGKTMLHQVDQLGTSGILRVESGKTDEVQFAVTPKSTAWIGRVRQYLFQTKVIPSSGEASSFSCAVTAQPLIPTWGLMVILLVFILSFCGLIFIISQPGRQSPSQVSGTATVTEQSPNTTPDLLTTATGLALADRDGDGLQDSREQELGTNPELLDTDLDGLTDGEEVTVHKTNALKADSDEDGLTDGDEVSRGINPLKRDTDGDGLTDGQEIRINTDPKSADSDQDGISDEAEASSCSSPTDPDSDDDRVSDSSDLDPCDANNPSRTKTAQAAIPTGTISPTVTQTNTPASGSATPIPSPTDQVPALSGSLLFSSNRDGQQQIYQQDMSSGIITRLTMSGGPDTLPAWSPDGSRVAFTTNRDGNQEIYVMNANGGNPVNLSNHPSEDVHPSWSPDGEWIAFSSDRDGNAEIYVMRADGSEQTNISRHPGNDVEPYWGVATGVFGWQEFILFVSDRDGDLDVYSMLPEGIFAINLTNNSANDHQPAFSPDGSRIAFVSEREGEADIFVMDPDGSNLLNLTASTNHSAASPTWSGDSQWLACNFNVSGDDEIYLLRADGSLVYNITGISSRDIDPAWR